MPERKIVIVFDEEKNRVTVPEGPFDNAVMFFGMLRMASFIMDRRLREAIGEQILIPAPPFIPKGRPS